MKKKSTFSLKISNILIIFIFLLQIILITHRTSFSGNLLINFYKKDAGLEEGIKNREILSILKIIKNNNLDSYKLSEQFLKSRKIKQRVFEASYPIRYDKNSRNYITNNKFIKNCLVKYKHENIYLFYCE